MANARKNLIGMIGAGILAGCVSSLPIECVTNNRLKSNYVSTEKGLGRIVQDGPQAGPPVAANGSKTDGVDYSVKVVDKYLARIGLVFFDEPVLQTSLTYFPKDLSGFNINYFENRMAGNGELTEVDLTLGYGVSADDFDVSFKALYGFLDAFLPFRDIVEVGARASTRNLPITIGAEVDAVFSPDNNRDVGGEAIAFARKDFNLFDSLKANAWTDLHFNNHYFIRDDNFSVANIGAGLRWNPFENDLLNVSVDAQQQYTLINDFDDQSLVSLSVGGSVKF